MGGLAGFEVGNQGHEPTGHCPSCSEPGGSEMTLEMTLVFIYHIYLPTSNQNSIFVT